MAVIQLGEDPFHGRFTEDRGPFLDPEAFAVLPHRSHLLVVQVDDLPMSTPKRCLAHFDVLRIRDR